ncbi:MAG TPA: helix-turn-helix domain-containing protein [Nocardioides sp.]|uniref:helix-turn-helix transcriptional regulator n=1 Tax=Nocardioides sp. TaxID=35761 RepID=UPI002D8016D9|nr:helix-turn-helix domain-containing protein [Nocardioides sp.]HET6651053.1 helix-turn-helix domain-containing protein [Nocardioides sp.]
MAEELEQQVVAVGALAEPVRWALYRYVAGSAEPVSREQASAAVDLPLHTAKFHLDRLVAEGLLDVEYRRLTGRTGPGAGRPSKLYRRADRQVSITLPERRYDLAGDLLAAAIDRSQRDGTPVGENVRAVARAAGLRIAAGSGEASDAGDEVALISGLLAAHGYEPRLADHDVCLANCPFDRLAAEHTDLVCGMNLALLEGVLEGLDVEPSRARLDPEPGLCCVKIAT